MEGSMQTEKTVNETKAALTEECRKALESCPHQRGTVNVMCYICRGHGDLFGWDHTWESFLFVECPRCHETRNNNVPEVCPCLEHFGKDVLLQTIQENEGSYPELAEAVRWIRLPDPEKSGKPIKGA